MNNEDSLSLKYYFKELRKIKVLDSNEQMELCIKAKNGDLQATNKLVECNLRFVITIAKEYLYYCNLPLADLISEGNLGILNAIKKYDPDKKIKFITYAVWWIRQAISSYIDENESCIRIPMNRIDIREKVKKTKELLYKKLNREPTIQEISKQCKIREIDVKNSFLDNYKPISIYLNEDNVKKHFSDNHKPTNTYLNKDDECENFLYEIKDDTCFNKKQTENNDVVKFKINDILSELNEREKNIIKMYYGIGDNDEMNLKEIGIELNLTKERIRKIKEIALKKVRASECSVELKRLIGFRNKQI